MAHSFAGLTATELALRAADKPLLIAQAIPVTPTFAGWNATGTVAGGDLSATGFPAARAYDGLTHLTTKRNASGNTYYFVMQFPSPGIEFDWLGVLGPNSTYNGINFQLQIADNSIFTTNLRTLRSGVVATTDARFTDADLFHTGSTAIRYTDVEFVRLVFTSGVASQAELGDVILGRSRQLKHKPRTPYDDGSLTGMHSDTETAAGVRLRYTYNDGRRVLRASINPSEEPYLSDIPDWYRTGDRYGRSPFVWAENPGTSPGSWVYMQMDQPDLLYPVQDFVERTFDIAAQEQGPERYYLERE